jgi:hypothetical protein
MGEGKGGAAITHRDTCCEKRFSSLRIFAFAVAACRIEHHANIYAAVVGCDHCAEQCRLREQKQENKICHKRTSYVAQGSDR